MKAAAKKARGREEKDGSYYRIRHELMKSLRKALRGPQDKLDPAVRNVTIKFSRLPFATMQGACEGFFYRRGKTGIERIALPKTNPKERFRYHSAYFCIILDGSPEAREFRTDLEGLKKKIPSVEIEGARESSVINVYAHRPRNSMTVTKETAYKIREDNLRFIKEFERIVDKYLKRYSLRGKP